MIVSETVGQKRGSESSDADTDRGCHFKWRRRDASETSLACPVPFVVSTMSSMIFGLLVSIHWILAECRLRLSSKDEGPFALGLREMIIYEKLFCLGVCFPLPLFL